MDFFTLIERRAVSDIEGECLLYKHNQTGAIVAFMKNTDNHRTMSIAFRTPPKDNRGIPHIIEHSVFCGSKKYPLSDPFVELMKGTIYTFLNAMTYSDATVYPVASTNKKDFDKLVDVYLDAVFNPLFLDNPQIFAQEGWQKEERNGIVTANGVVLNEMKGLENTSEFVLENNIKAALYSDSEYRYVSGGMPSDIIKLRHQDAVDYYNEYYHPSNCIVIFYGDVDVEEKLLYLHNEYFGAYESRDIKGIIDYTLKTNEKNMICEYPGDSDFLAYGICVANEHSAINDIALQVIDYILSSSNGAILRDRYMKAHMGEDFDAYLDDGVRQPYMVFQASYTSATKAARFRKLVDDALAEIVQNGVSDTIVEAALKIIEFGHKEGDYTGSPKGLVYSDNLLERLLYNEPDPISRICIDEAIEHAKITLNGQAVTQLISDMLVHSKIKRLLVVKGRKKLARINEKNFAGILAQTDNGVINCQKTTNLSEDLTVISVLDKADIDINRKYVPTEKVSVGNTSLLLQNRKTKGIGYLNIAMDIRVLPKELLQYSRVLVELLAMVDTAKYDYSELNTVIDANTGGIYNYIEIVDKADSDEVIPYLVQHSSFFYESMEKAFALNREVLYDSVFDNAKYIKELLLQLKSVYVSQYEEGSPSIARGLAMQGVNRAAIWQEKLQGHDFYVFLCGLLENFEHNFEKIKTAIKQTLDLLSKPENVGIFYIGEPSSYEELKKLIGKYWGNCSNVKSVINKDEFEPVEIKKAYTIATPVNYIALCAKLQNETRRLRGHILVLEHILNCEYLWNQVRVKGGAYGSTVQIELDGTINFSSMRDPQMADTIEIFKAVPRYIETLELSERELRQYIVGTMNKMEVPASAEAEGMIQLRLDMSGVSNDEILAIRKQVVNTELADLKALAPYFAEALKNYSLVIMGNEDNDYHSVGIDDIESVIVH